MSGARLTVDRCDEGRSLELDLGYASLSVVFPAAVWRDQLAALVERSAALDAAPDDRASAMSHAARASRR